MAAGTMRLRLARNASEFVDAVVARTGVRVDILAGDEEARLSFLGAASTFRKRPTWPCSTSAAAAPR